PDAATSSWCSGCQHTHPDSERCRQVKCPLAGGRLCPGCRPYTGMRPGTSYDDLWSQPAFRTVRRQYAAPPHGGAPPSSPPWWLSQPLRPTLIEGEIVRLLEGFTAS